MAGAALTAVAARRLDHAAWAPSHRRSAAVALVAGIAAVYAAANVYSLDRRLIESFGRTGASGEAPAPALVVAAVATALVPLAVLAWGIGARRTLLVDAGIVLAALSLVTLRHYVHVAPLWLVLVAGGAALRRCRRLGRARARAGPRRRDTRLHRGSPLHDERRQLTLQVVPVVATLSPSGSSPSDQPKSLGAGGAFGGAGASEKF